MLRHVDYLLKRGYTKEYAFNQVLSVKKAEGDVVTLKDSIPKDQWIQYVREELRETIREEILNYFKPHSWGELREELILRKDLEQLEKRFEQLEQAVYLHNRKLNGVHERLNEIVDAFNNLLEAITVDEDEDERKLSWASFFKR